VGCDQSTHQQVGYGRGEEGFGSLLGYIQETHVGYRGMFWLPYMI
jgi:hypothetical protein